MAVEYLGSGVVNLDLRPLRAGYLIKPRDAAGFKRAILLACDRWGGQQEPILPISGRGRLRPLWGQLLNVARVDMAVDLANLDPNVRGQLGTRLGCPIWPADQFEQYADRTHPLGAHSAEEVSTLDLVQPSSRSVGALAGAGAVPDQAELEEWLDLGARVRESTDPVEVAVGQLRERTVLATTVHQCGELEIANWAGSIGVVWVAPPGSLRDALFFWNVRARMTARLMPAFAVMVDPTSARSDAFAEVLKRRAQALGEVQPAFALCSLSVPPVALRELIAHWGFSEQTSGEIRRSYGGGKPKTEREVTVAVNWNLGPFLPLGKRIDGVRQPVLAQLFRPQTKLLLPSPVSFHPQIGGSLRMRISGPPELGLPPSQPVVKLVHKDALPSQVGFELNTWARPLYELDIAIPTRHAVLTALLNERGIRYKVNIKGDHTRGVRHLASDPELFGSANLEAVITALTGARSKRLADELGARLKNVREEERRELAALFAEEEARSFLTLEQIANKASVARPDCLSALSRLMRQRLAERGVTLKCLECGIRSFVPLDRATEPASCPACTSHAIYQTSAAGEPLFHYRLNSLLERASGQGVVVHLFGIAGLLRQDPRIFVLEAADIFRGNDRLGEADLICLSESDVFLGEAKRTSSSFTRNQISKDLRLAGVVGATTYVMVCMQPIGQELEQIALALAKRQGVGLLVVDGPEARAREVRPIASVGRLPTP